MGWFDPFTSMLRTIRNKHELWPDPLTYHAPTHIAFVAHGSAGVGASWRWAHTLASERERERQRERDHQKEVYETGADKALP